MSWSYPAVTLLIVVTLGGLGWLGAPFLASWALIGLEGTPQLVYTWTELSAYRYGVVAACCLPGLLGLAAALLYRKHRGDWPGRASRTILVAVPLLATMAGFVLGVAMTTGRITEALELARANGVEPLVGPYDLNIPSWGAAGGIIGEVVAYVFISLRVARVSAAREQ